MHRGNKRGKAITTICFRPMWFDYLSPSGGQQIQTGSKAIIYQYNNESYLCVYLEITILIYVRLWCAENKSTSVLLKSRYYLYGHFYIHNVHVLLFFYICCLARTLYTLPNQHT